MNITTRQFQIARLFLRGFLGQEIEFPMAFIAMLNDQLQYQEQANPEPRKENA